jgi:threonine dehydrogenase-like Zn-dependent dehydrogenase
MKALVYTRPSVLEFRDMADPVPQADEVLVAVRGVGICGSDMYAWHGHDARRPAPLILGHEAAGRIVSGPRKGERVTINPLVSCGQCDDCVSGRSNICGERQIISMPPRDGAFAELVRIPERNVVTIPPSMPVAKAALAEPVAVSYHAIKLAMRALHRPLPQARCIVIGGGAIGLAAALCLEMFGATSIDIFETNVARHATLAAAGPFRVYVPGIDNGAPESADLVIDAVGSNATRASASRLVRPGGVIVHTGLQGGEGGLDIRRLTLQEVTFIGTYTYSMVDFRETVAALASGQLGPLDWFEERPLAEGATAFDDLDQGRSAAAKIILRP